MSSSSVRDYFAFPWSDFHAVLHNGLSSSGVEAGVKTPARYVPLPLSCGSCIPLPNWKPAGNWLIHTPLMPSNDSRETLLFLAQTKFIKNQVVFAGPSGGQRVSLHPLHQAIRKGCEKQCSREERWRANFLVFSFLCGISVS